jgi:hypothetical protein
LEQRLQLEPLVAPYCGSPVPATGTGDYKQLAVTQHHVTSVNFKFFLLSDACAWGMFVKGEE